MRGEERRGVMGGCLCCDRPVPQSAWQEAYRNGKLVLFCTRCGSRMRWSSVREAFVMLMPSELEEPDVSSVTGADLV